MKIQNSERQNSECAFYESQRELGSQRLQLQQASQWADHPQREKSNLGGELEKESSASREPRKKLPRIKELKRR